jgi:hypothetical protein
MFVALSLIAFQQTAAVTGIPAVDSATVARAAYARASAALRANDLATARRETDRAAAAWPTQPAYIWARAAAALRSADTTRLLDALTRYASLGLGRDLERDTLLARYAALPRFRDVAARHAALLAPAARSVPRVVLPDTTLFPEGVDVDPRTGFFYVTSIRHRTIAEVTPGGDYVRDVLPRGGVGLGAMMAVRVDEKRNVLWATMSGLPQMEGYTPADSAVNALLRISLPEGEIQGRWDLPPSSTGHTLGDVALGPLGDVYVSDSREPVLYRFEPDSSSPALIPIRHPLFRSLQGIAPIDGRTVIVADYSHGLLKVDLPSGEVTRIADAPNSTSLGVDGIAWHDGAIIGVQNGVSPPRIMRFELDTSRTRITRAGALDRNTTIADEPTSGVVVGDDFIYVANSQWEKYNDSGARIPGTVLRRPVLLMLPIGRR